MNGEQAAQVEQSPAKPKQAHLKSTMDGVKLAFVPTDRIWFDKRFRVDMADLTSLAESIREKGVLQPLTVTPEFELLAGGRRLAASKSIGLAQVPCLIRAKEDVVDAREIELIENVFRAGFTWDEECALIQEIDRLYKERSIDWSGRKTAQLLHKGVASVSRALQLANACDHIPELRDYKTADEALKVLKKLEEQVIVGELRKRQDAGHGLSKGLQLMLKIADANYRIQDSFVGLAELRSGGEVHLIECDPPYGIDLNAVKASKDSVDSNVHTYHEVEQAEYPAFLKRLAKELFRVANANCWLVFWFGPTWFHEVKSALADAGWKVDDIPAVWIKSQGQTLQPELYLARAYEPFFLARKGNPLIMKRGRLNVFQYSQAPNKIHPTERPVPLIQEILETLGVPQSIVLCPFLGSGNTLRAAYNLGMRAMGFDISSEYKDRFMLRVEEDTRALDAEAAALENEDDE